MVGDCCREKGGAGTIQPEVRQGVGIHGDARSGFPHYDSQQIAGGISDFDIGRIRRIDGGEISCAIELAASLAEAVKCVGFLAANEGEMAVVRVGGQSIRGHDANIIINVREQPLGIPQRRLVPVNKAAAADMELADKNPLKRRIVVLPVLLERGESSDVLGCIVIIALPLIEKDGPRFVGDFCLPRPIAEPVVGAGDRSGIREVIGLGVIPLQLRHGIAGAGTVEDGDGDALAFDDFAAHDERPLAYAAGEAGGDVSGNRKVAAITVRLHPKRVCLSDDRAVAGNSEGAYPWRGVGVGVSREGDALGIGLAIPEKYIARRDIRALADKAEC